MPWSYESAVQKQLGVIYVALNHIYLIQKLKILTLKNLYDDVNIWSPVI